MDELYAALGRKQFQLEAQDKEYDRLLQLLAGVVDGSVETSRVTVKLAERSWSLTPTETKPETPNGQG